MVPKFAPPVPAVIVSVVDVVPSVIDGGLKVALTSPNSPPTESAMSPVKFEERATVTRTVPLWPGARRRVFGVTVYVMPASESGFVGSFPSAPPQPATALASISMAVENIRAVLRGYIDVLFIENAVNSTVAAALWKYPSCIE
jgi:hypothetical protein